MAQAQRLRLILPMGLELRLLLLPDVHSMLGWLHCLTAPNKLLMKSSSPPISKALPADALLIPPFLLLLTFFDEQMNAKVSAYIGRIGEGHPMGSYNRIPGLKWS